MNKLNAFRWPCESRARAAGPARGSLLWFLIRLPPAQRIVRLVVFDVRCPATPVFRRLRRWNSSPPPPPPSTPFVARPSDSELELHLADVCLPKAFVDRQSLRLIWDIWPLFDSFIAQLPSTTANFPSLGHCRYLALLLWIAPCIGFSRRLERSSKCLVYAAETLKTFRSKESCDKEIPSATLPFISILSRLQ